MKTAVLYLRVSTTGQVETDYDPEGISIPAQRLACERKAQQMGVMVVGEYVEPGRSATTMEKRPVFQQMLERLGTERDADYVIVYNLSRLNRNRVDDAKVLMTFRAMKVALVSAQENIDETPAGQLMHGILAAFNEYRSTADGADIRYKMGQKAKSGGTLGRAPIGYLNVRERYEGREVRSVGIDPERAPLVRLAFERYATGNYSIERLHGVLADKGLRTRATGRNQSGPVSTSRLWMMLRDPYYTGIVVYKGEEFSGRHEPLVSEALFARVQSVLDTNRAATERRRVHHHYLKGSLMCARCAEQGRVSRMMLQRTFGRHGGEYWYFFCRARQEHLCDNPHIAVDKIEDAVLRRYATLQVPEAFIEQVTTMLKEALDEERRGSHLAAESARARLQALTVKEDNLLDLAADAEIPKDRLRARLAAIRQERDGLEKELVGFDDRLEAGAEVIRAGLNLLRDPQALYRQADGQTRRMLNQAFFEQLYVDGPEVTEEELAAPFDELLYSRHRPRFRQRPDMTKAGRAGQTGLRSTKSGLLAAAMADGGSSKTLMVELRGLEPLTPTLPGRLGGVRQHTWASINAAQRSVAPPAHFDERARMVPTGHHAGTIRTQGVSEDGRACRCASTSRAYAPRVEGCRTRKWRVRRRPRCLEYRAVQQR